MSASVSESPATSTASGRVPGRLELIRRHPVDRYHPWITGAVVLTIVLAPLMLTSYWLFVVSQILIVVVIAAGMNLIVGNAGQLALSSVAFYAMGAYGYAWISERTGSMPLGLLGSLVLVAMVSAAVGSVALRLQGLYLAIVTFGIIFVAHDLVLNLTGITGGAVGVGVVERSGSDNRFIAFSLVGISVLVVLAIGAAMRRTSYGRALEAIRQCEDAAAAFGVNRLRYVLVAFVFSSVTAALAGALYAYTIGYLSPEPFTVHGSLMHLTVIVVGGLGTVIGPFLGGLVVGLLTEELRNYPDVQEVLFGVLLLVFLLFIRGGLVGLLADLSGRVTRRRDARRGGRRRES